MVAGGELVEQPGESHGYFAYRDNPQLPLMFSLKATTPPAWSYLSRMARWLAYCR